MPFNQQKLNFPFTSLLAISQSVYFIITGLWPIADIESFMLVSGLKTDLWLVKTTGTLITAIGLAIFTACKLKEISISIILLAIISSLGLMMIDLYYVSTDVISPVYLADALTEAVIIGGWLYVLLKIKS